MVGRMDGAVLPTIKSVQSQLQIHPQQQVSEARVVAEGLCAMCPLTEMFLRVREICGR